MPNQLRELLAEAEIAAHLRFADQLETLTAEGHDIADIAAMWRRIAAEIAAKFLTADLGDL